MRIQYSRHLDGGLLKGIKRGKSKEEEDCFSLFHKDWLESIQFSEDRKV